MRTTTALILAFLTLATGVSFAGSLDTRLSLPPTHTFSIVCYDSTTGQIGAAVQSHYFRAVDVISAEPGVGAVATQSFADYRYATLGIEMMRTGKTAEQALAGVLASDQYPNYRQVGMVDIHGGSATHTGGKCLVEGGGRKGPGYAVQASLMAKNTVWDAMSNAFETTPGDLATRMMAALEAAQGEGGDLRGMQSAAMLVVTANPVGDPRRDVLVDIRVDDASQPLQELKRLLNITRAAQKSNAGDALAEAGKFDEATAAYAEAVALYPENPEIPFWQAVTLVGHDQVDRALPMFKRVFQKEPVWRTVIQRLVGTELLPDKPDVVKKILEQ